MFGDLNASVPLTVVAATSVARVTWNGVHIPVHSDGRGVLTGRLTQSPASGRVKVPKLAGWKFKDSLPEVQSGFDDSAWTVADHTTTNITQKPLFGDGSVLYGACSSLARSMNLFAEHSWFRLRL